MMRWLALLGAAVVGCAPEAPTTTSSSALSEQSCTTATLRVFDEYPGAVGQLFIDLPVDGTVRPFMADTGSEISYRYLDPSNPAPSRCCLTSTLHAIPGLGERTTEDGAVVGGKISGDVLGADRVFDFDIAHGRFSFVAAPIPANAVTLPLTFHESSDPWAANMLTATGAKLEGADIELLVDTGSSHVLIISNEPRPDEERVETHDGNGNPVTLWISLAEISFGDGKTYLVDLDRAEVFPSLEKTFAALGGNVKGILGLTALGHERLVVTKTSMSFVPNPDFEVTPRGNGKPAAPSASSAD